MNADFFAAHGTRLESLIDPVTGQAWLDGGTELVELGMVRGDAIDWTGDPRVVVDVRVEADTEAEGRLILRLAVSNRAEDPIGSVVFPRLAGLHPGTGARLTWPFCAGSLLPFDRIDEGEVLELTYPAYASMQWLDLYRPDGRGLYLGAHDPEPHFKYLMAGRQNGRAMLAFEWHGVMIRPGETLVFPPVILAFHGRFWQGGADIYRDWIADHLVRRPIPEWFAKDPTTYCTSLKAQDAPKPRRMFADLPAMARDIRKSRGRILHAIGYHENGFDTDYPQYYPGACMGGPDALRKGAEGMRAEGVELSFYTNGRIMDSTWPDPDEIHQLSVKRPKWSRDRMARMWDGMVRPDHNSWDPRGSFEPRDAAWNVDGHGVTENWGHTFAACCPGSPRWREILTERLVSLAKEFGAKVFQMDQVAGCWGLACFDETHGHEHERPSLAWSRYRDFIRELRLHLSRVDPAICLWTEGINDLLGESYDCNQFSSGFSTLLKGKGRWHPELFFYTFPEFMAYSHDIRPDDLALLHLTFATKGHFFYANHDDTAWADRCSPRFLDYHHFLLEVRSRVWDVVAYGRLLLPAIPWPEEVQAFAYEYEGRVVLLATPPSDSGATLDAPWAYELALPDGLEHCTILWQERFRGEDDPPARLDGGVLGWRGVGALAVELKRG